MSFAFSSIIVFNDEIKIQLPDLVLMRPYLNSCLVLSLARYQPLLTATGWIRQTTSEYLLIM
jgi:hypothetical protein